MAEVWSDRELFWRNILLPGKDRDGFRMILFAEGIKRKEREDRKGAEERRQQRAGRLATWILRDGIRYVLQDEPHVGWKLAIGVKWWEISHMMTLVAADEKGRVPIRGSRPGQKYLVTRAGSEWRITEYVSKGHPKRNSRDWAGSKQKSSKGSIWAVLRSMGEDGLTIEPATNAKQAVPPCQF